MPSETEDLNVNIETGAGPVVRSATGLVALVAPLGVGATVSANVVKKYRRASDVAADHGTNSRLHLGAKAAFDSGQTAVLTVGVAAVAGGPFTETYGDGGAADQSDDGDADPLANAPITGVTAVSRDGVNILAGVRFTSGDPFTSTPGAAEIVINPKTGHWKLGTSTTGSGAGLVITYESSDWDAAFEALDAEQYDYHVPAGYALNAQNFGIFDAFVSHGTTAKKMTAAGLDSGVFPEDIDGTGGDLFNITHIDNPRLYPVLAAYYTGDMTSAAAAAATTRRVNATLKRQTAPTGVTYTGHYKRAQFGDEVTPTTQTFHYLGVNAVFRDRGGTYRISNDRARVGLTDFYRFGSTMRSRLFVENRCEEDVSAARESSGTALPFTEAGLAAVQSVLLGSLGFCRDEGIIDTFVLTMPKLAELEEADLANRHLKGVDAAARFTGQIHAVDLDLKLSV